MNNRKNQDVIVFQEEILPESNPSSVMMGKPRRSQDINKVYFIGDPSGGTSAATRGILTGKALQEEFSKLQVKRIDWQSVNYSSFTGKECSFTPPRGNDWSIIVLPSLTNHLDFQSGHWHKILNQCCKSSKVVFVLSFESNDCTLLPTSLCTAEEESKTQVEQLVANAAYGSLLCAQWEFPQCMLKLIRFQSSHLFQEDPKKVVFTLLQECLADASLKRIEIFAKVEEATGKILLSSNSYLKTPSFESFLDVNQPYNVPLPSLPTEQNGVFIITGGLGSLGLISAHVLMDYGFRRLALISRSGKASINDQDLEKLLYHKQQQCGAIIKIYNCDVSKKDEVEKLLQTVRSELCDSKHSLRGVVHSAGILRDGLLCSGKAEAGANEVWNTKIHSAAYLDELTQEDSSFQYFITFSSLAAAAGNVGQATYAAANRALEYVIRPRSLKPAAWNYNMIHIRWPGIIGSNMGKVFDASMKTIMMSLEQVSQFLFHLFSHWDDFLGYHAHTLTPIPVGIFAKMKGAWMLEKFDVKGQLLPHEKPRPTPPVLPTESEKEIVNIGKDDSTPSLASLSIESIQSQVKQLVINLLGDDEEEAIKLNTPLLTMGLDSITAAELALQLSIFFQLDLPATMLYSYPTIDSIAKYVYELLHPVKKDEMEVEKFPSTLYCSVSLTSKEERIRKQRSKSPSQSSVSSSDSSKESSLSSGSDSDRGGLSSLSSSRGSILPFDEIGIIGLALDFPNGLHTLTELFQLLSTKSSTVSQVAKNTLLVHDHLVKHAVENHGFDANALLAKLQYGNYLTAEQKATFEANEFKVTANEAESMDLSQKLLLMNCKKALIDAGVYEVLNDPMHEFYRYYKNTGVYVGIGGVTPTESGSFLSSPSKLNEEYSSQKDGKGPSSKASSPRSDASGLSSYSATANTTSVAAGRISFAFGFEGPCMSIDTACSSSFVALHAARRALQLRECNLAIVAGINLIDEKLSLACAIAGMTSSDGISHTFDVNADGYGRSEGCGVIILKRKEDCLRDGQKVYGMIKGSAVQQDGASASLTAPNGLAQESVIRNALRDAKVTPEAIRFIEAHGTGTQYGDPVETTAIANVFGQARTADNPLYISAIKANIGHLEAAAGIAGIFATILSFQQEVSLPNAQLKQLNPLIQQSLQDYQKAIIISSEAHELKRYASKSPVAKRRGGGGGAAGGGSCFLAGISSFGYSGTIAHVILEEPTPSQKRCITTQKIKLSKRIAAEPTAKASSSSTITNEAKPLEPKEKMVSSDAMEFAKFFFGVKAFKEVPAVLSSSSSDEESEQMKKSSKKISSSHKAIPHRNTKKEKKSFPAESKTVISNKSDTEVESFQAPSDNASIDSATSASSSSSFVSDQSTAAKEEEQQQPSPVIVDTYEPSDPQLIWQFSGQGNLKVNAGRNYYHQNEVYRSTLLRCAEIVRPWLDLNILDILYPEINQTYSITKATDLMTQTRYSQVILIALEYSLAQSLLALGHAPAAVTGHSLGEYTAAMIIGVMTLEEGLYLVSHRGRIIEENHRTCEGKMLAIRYDPIEFEKNVAKFPQNYRSEVSIAGINGYNSLVISGSERAINYTIKTLNITASIPLAVKHAFHSPLLQSIVPPLKEVLAKIHFKPFQSKKIHYFSTYLGREIIPDAVTGQHELMKVDYWIGHMIEKVNYVKMIESAVHASPVEGGGGAGRRFVHFMEIGPEKVLMKLSQTIVKTLQIQHPELKNINITSAAVLE